MEIPRRRTASNPRGTDTSLPRERRECVARPTGGRDCCGWELTAEKGSAAGSTAAQSPSNTTSCTHDTPVLCRNGRGPSCSELTANDLANLATLKRDEERRER